LGKGYQMQVAKLKKPAFINDLFLVPDQADSSKLNVLLSRFFKEKAYDILQDRLQVYAKKMDLYPTQFFLSNAKARWGSCSSLGVIRLNWRLIFTPFFALDYVVIHELAHLKELNHGLHFWSLVKEHDVNYKVAEKWLKGHRQLLGVLR